MNFQILLAFASIAAASANSNGGTGECPFTDTNEHCALWKHKYCTDPFYGSAVTKTCGKSCKCDLVKPLCGKDNPAGLARIMGGINALPNQFPWMVRLPMGCGGSLITGRHILTAKHCFDDERKNYIGGIVKVSVHNQNNPEDYETVRIENYFYPPVADNDLAIVVLVHPVDLSDKSLGTVCLPASADEDYRGEKALAMGWGMATVSSNSWLAQHPTLKQVLLTVSSTEKQNYLYTKVDFYAGTYHEPCKGDSGGPLVHKDDVTGRWTIIGTVVGGAYDCSTGKVDKNHPEGIWNKVTDHLDWIKFIIRNF